MFRRPFEASAPLWEFLLCLGVAIARGWKSIESSWWKPGYKDQGQMSHTVVTIVFFVDTWVCDPYESLIGTYWHPAFGPWSRHPRWGSLDFNHPASLLPSFPPSLLPSFPPSLRRVDRPGKTRPDKMSDRMPMKMSEYMSEYMSDRMSDRMSENMWNKIQMVCQNVCHIRCQTHVRIYATVGITLRKHVFTPYVIHLTQLH